MVIKGRKNTIRWESPLEEIVVLLELVEV
jgi:hypothetical protein